MVEQVDSIPHYNKVTYFNCLLFDRVVSLVFTFVSMVTV